MKLDLQGAQNARDLGGIVTPFGTTAYNKLIRSGKLGNLSQKDLDVFARHKLQRIIDLRTTAEMTNHPDYVIEGVSYTQISVIRATTFGISYEKLDGATIADKLEQGVQRMQSRGETPISHMNILYKNFVEDDYCLDAYGKFLITLADHPTDGATLWHCSAGKDRVGTCTALLLYCLGASHQQIMEDYLLTNQQTEKYVSGVLQKIKDFVPQNRLELVQSMLTVKDSYLQSFWQGINERFASVNNFLRACGVTEEHVQKLRQNYLV